jgi:hypothetical protein
MTLYHDNILSSSDFDDLKRLVFSNQFPWFYVSTAYNQTGTENKFSYSWSHSVLEDGKIISPYYNLFSSVFKIILSQLGKSVDIDLMRIRLGCIGITKDTYIHDPHVDREIDHQVGLLYLNSCDGCTYVYQERFDQLKKYNPKIDSLTIAEKILPKENLYVEFSGLNYHSSSTPTDVDRRIVVTFNYLNR